MESGGSVEYLQESLSANLISHWTNEKQVPHTADPQPSKRASRAAVSVINYHILVVRRLQVADPCIAFLRHHNALDVFVSIFKFCEHKHHVPRILPFDQPITQRPAP
jgi:hypothetical protein